MKIIWTLLFHISRFWWNRHTNTRACTMLNEWIHCAAIGSSLSSIRQSGMLFARTAATFLYALFPSGALCWVVSVESMIWLGGVEQNQWELSQGKYHSVAALAAMDSGKLHRWLPAQSFTEWVFASRFVYDVAVWQMDFTDSRPTHNIENSNLSNLGGNPYW